MKFVLPISSFLFVLSSFSALFACSGDCLACHEKLKPYIQDNDHRILTECVSCHNEPKSAHGECGKDCFACHDKQKLYGKTEVTAHASLKSCSQCHQEPIDLLNPKQTLIQKPQNLKEFFK